MVQELNRSQQPTDFPETAPTAYPVFYRTYSRRMDGDRESWQQTADRTLRGLTKLGKLSPEETALIDRMQKRVIALPSGRWLWVGGTEWLENPQNFSGAYNCTSTNVIDWKAFGLMMDLAMMGCGTGGVLEPHYISQLPPVRNAINVTVTGELGSVPAADRLQETTVDILGNAVRVVVGDSRQGWVKSYQTLLDLCSDDRFEGEVNIAIDLSNVRPAGETLRGFGGVANPIKLPELYARVTRILNRAIGRQLTSVECCLLIDEAAVTIVAGNIRRSAGIRQFDSNDELGATAKDNLWQQDESGNWRIDPDRDSLRMANHSRVFHHKPTETECIDAVRKQFYSGEGAIQWAGEAIARSNADLISGIDEKKAFIAAFQDQKGAAWLKTKAPQMDERESAHRLQRYGLNPCVTADTWVHTEFGPRQVKELIGQQHGTYVNGELFSTTAEGFFYTGDKSVFKVTTREGLSLRLTANHQLLRVSAQTQKRQYLEWTAVEDLKPGDHLSIHNHRDIQPWSGHGTFDEGWLLGNLVGDGSLAETSWSDQGILRFWGDSQQEMAEYAVATLQKTVACGAKLAGSYHPHHHLHQIASSGLAALADRFGIHRREKWVTGEIERSSYEFHCGFLRGLFDADGSVQGTQQKGISVRLAQSNLATLEAVQRMLLRIGIVSTIYQNRRTAGVRLMPDSDRNLAPYFCQAQHELVIANDNLTEFRDRVGFQQPEKQAKLNELLSNYKRKLNRDRFSVTIAEIEPDGIEAVYDCTVPGPSRFDANGFVAHNCGEILGADFHCVAGNTLLITRDGLHEIQSLVGQSVEVWNGRRWSSVTPILTGRDRSLFRVNFADGTHLDVTEGHRFFVKDRFGQTYQERTTAELIDQLPNLKYAIHTEPFQIDHRDGEAIDPIWAYTLGQLVGDGSLCQSHGKPQLQLRLYGVKRYQKELAIAGRTSGQPRFYAENPDTPCLLYTGFNQEFDPEQVRNLKQAAEPFEAIARWNREAILHFIAGLIDADGSLTATGGVRLYLSGYDRAYRVYLLLLKCGIRSSINLMARAGEATNLGVRQKDLWYLQITDCAAIPCQRVDTSRGHQPTAKGKWQVIRSIEPLDGRHDTFCFNELEFHKGVFGGTLTGQCNLSEIHLNQIDPKDHQTQEDAFKAGALSVAGLLNHRFQEERYQYSRSIDPIVGVSFTGLFDFFVQAFGVDWLRWWEAGRPDTVQGLEFKDQERQYLSRWREIVHQTVWDYCDRHGLRRPNRCTTVQPAGCLDRTALRIFDQGLLYADEIVAPGSGETVGLDLTVRGGVAADTAIANQPLNLVRVTLANGRVLRMTPNHRLSIAGQWVRADELQVGMEIDHSLGEYAKAEDALLLPLDLHSYDREGRKEIIGHGRGVLTRTISTPTTLNPELGYFLGCLYGDGAISEHKYRVRFAFNSQEYDLVERLQQIAERWFGLTGTVNIDPRNNGSRGELVFATKQLFDWFKLNGLDKSASTDLDRIPQAIRRSSRETILAFFCGLIDTDGCIREKGSLSIDSASEAFIRNLQQVGEAVGLSFSIFHNNQGSNFQAAKDMWGLCLSRMASQPAALEYLNAHSRKCALRPLPSPKRHFAFHPYEVAAIEFETSPDYSYDFAVAGVDDDDSWYWQGGLKSHNTKSLLTGASPGWHPPKAARFIRRITFRKNDPVALACLDYGYSVVPSQSDKDENGHLLNDPFDPRCTEWLVEIPVAVSWADLPGADTIAIEQFSALAQFDFYMQVQTHYTTHNTSATIELREPEIEPLGQRIHQAIQNDEGYISAALLARFDDLQTFPRLPFEPISRETYQEMHDAVLERRRISSFHEALRRYDLGEMAEAGPAGCDSDKCLLPDTKG